MNTQESLKHFASVSELVKALEHSVDLAFPGKEHRFGYFSREGWNFEGRGTAEGIEVWLNFWLEGDKDFRKTETFTLPKTLTNNECTSWTRTIMNKALQQR
jgi:hypothetical protein